MKKIAFLILSSLLFGVAVFISNATITANGVIGWNLYKVPYNNMPIEQIAPDADLLLTFKNNAWYGISPNQTYSTNELQSKNILPLSSLSQGDGLWIFFSQSGTINFDGNVQNNCQNQITLQTGWNLVSFPCDFNYFVVDQYFNSDLIESVWSYDNYTKKWKVYSSNTQIQDDIKNDSSLDFLESITASQAMWVYAKSDTTIHLINKAPYFQTTPSLNINENTMDSFAIDFKDPNGDPLNVTLSGEDSALFEVDALQVVFKNKPILFKPKNVYNLQVKLNDGTTEVSRDFVITINLRSENIFSGVHANIVGYDDTNHRAKQWYLEADYLNITGVHQAYPPSLEKRIVTQIVEGGLNTSHEDLIANMDFSMAYDASTQEEGKCLNTTNSHGTNVAGIIGARGNNGIGIMGINPYGKLTCFKLNSYEGLLQPSSGDLQKAYKDGPRANEIAISSNSWGECTNQSLLYDAMLAYGNQHLRNEKGRVYLFAAGNHRIGDERCANNSANLNNMLNTPHTITVAALLKNGQIYPSSTPGANVWISAYGEDIWTTHSSGELKYATFGATSAATPQVAGGIGLILQECPQLSARDLKYILAKTATPLTNANNIQNGARIVHSLDVGFGKLNTLGAINMCKNGYIPLPENSTLNISQSINTNLIGNQTFEINVNENKKIEWVSVYFDGRIDNIGEYEIYLKSPNGTTKKLMHSNNPLKNLNLNTNGFYLSTLSNSEAFRLSSAGFLDENTQGVWQIIITDPLAKSENKINTLLRALKLEITAY